MRYDIQSHEQNYQNMGCIFHKILCTTHVLLD